MSELDIIQEAFKGAMSFENKIARFEALQLVAQQTDGSSLPSAIKDRINKAILEKQYVCSGLLEE